MGQERDKYSVSPLPGQFSGKDINRLGTKLVLFLNFLFFKTLFSPAICYDAQHPRYEVINKIKFNEVLEVHGNLNVEVFIISTTF
jgi:hypothetical protein